MRIIIFIAVCQQSECSCNSAFLHGNTLAVEMVLQKKYVLGFQDRADDNYFYCRLTTGNFQQIFYLII